MDGTQRAFPIREADGETKMKNIIPSSLPHFHQLASKDPDTFMFVIVLSIYYSIYKFLLSLEDYIVLKYF